MAAGDDLVSKIVDMLESITLELKLGIFVGSEQEVQNLSHKLQSIQAVLTNANRMQLTDEAVRLWLDRLKRETYDIDDAFDEWSYEIHKSQFVKRKVWSFYLLSACFCFRNKASKGLPIAVKINNLNAWLGVIAIEKDRYCLESLWSDDEQSKRPLTTTVINIPEMKGRDTDKEKLANLLLAESGDLPKVHTISIVGMGGIGKTTLAKQVYNDEMVESHFNKRIWVCVSEPFDKFRIAREILKSLVAHTPNLVNLQSITAKIQQSIKGKKFLLVLDDVLINEDVREWMELKDCLTCGSWGSKILVITRKEKVAKLMGCFDVDIFRLGLLSIDECLSLFNEIAFYMRTSQDRQTLESIGEEIVARCKGLPLAVKTIAGVLCFKESVHEWMDVLFSELWTVKIFKRGNLDLLWFSYYGLPSSLKQCYLYCAIFLKGYRLSKDELISLWMAHGFLKPKEDKDMEMVGDDYFHNLCMRFIFQDFEVEEKFNRLNKTYCKMHDIVHDFAKYIMGKECLCVNVNSEEEVTSSVDAAYSDGLYHLHVNLGEKGKFLDSFYNLRKLRSLVVSSPKNDSLIGTALRKMFNNFTCLRSLSLSRCRLETIPSNINRLIHLRWLKLSKNYALKELPDTIGELYNLQYLSVNWCAGLAHIPQKLERLINLRQLKNDHTYFLLPKGIGKLSGLRKLLHVTIDPKFKDAFSLRDLNNLNNISGSLTLFFMERECETLFVEDAKQAKLEEKKHITALSLNFPERSEEEWMQQQDEELVEALKPPTSLELLRITCYMGANSPSWINSLTSLKKLKLWYWSNCEHLPALGMLPCLEYVEFNNFGRVKKVSAAFYRMDGFTEASSSTAPLFPKLNNLQFMNLMDWEEWNDYDGDEEVMPCLRYLSIKNCPKLKALPNFIHRKVTLHKKIS